MRHSDAVVKLVVRSPAFGRSVVVAQFDHLAFAFVKSELVGGKGRAVGVAAVRRYHRIPGKTELELAVFQIKNLPSQP